MNSDAPPGPYRILRVDATRLSPPSPFPSRTAKNPTTRLSLIMALAWVLARAGEVEVWRYRFLRSDSVRVHDLAKELLLAMDSGSCRWGRLAGCLKLRWEVPRGNG